jgi:hypothetical protein
VQLFSGNKFARAFEQGLQHLKWLLLHFDSHAGFADLSLLKIHFIDPELDCRVLQGTHGTGVYHFCPCPEEMYSAMTLGISDLHGKVQFIPIQAKEKKS